MEVTLKQICILLLIIYHCVNIENYDCITCNYKARTQYSPVTDGKDRRIRQLEYRYDTRIVS
jgi:hypothetical protein